MDDNNERLRSLPQNLMILYTKKRCEQGAGVREGSAGNGREWWGTMIREWWYMVLMMPTLMPTSEAQGQAETPLGARVAN